MRARLMLSTAACAALLLAGAAQATDGDPAQADPVALFESVDFAPVSPLDPEASFVPADMGEDAPETQTPGEVLEDSDLAELSGGQAVTVTAQTTQTLTSTSTGNTVTGGTIGSGEVSIGAGAFSGYSGIGNFVINTGHNNTLQGSIGVTVAITPGP